MACDWDHFIFHILTVLSLTSYGIERLRTWVVHVYRIVPPLLWVLNVTISWDRSNPYRTVEEFIGFVALGKRPLAYHTDRPT